MDRLARPTLLPRVQGATVLGPGDFPIGSMQSRAAARLRLQKIGEVGKGSSECICFPEDEQPFFRTSEERDLAEGVQCPLHGIGEGSGRRSAMPFTRKAF